jgi:Zn-dependent protease
LNPGAHIDPIGTLLLPLLGIPFGWAKPVPVNPSRFRRSVHMSTGMAITAAAGPISNLLLAIGCAVALGLSFRFSPEVLARQPALYKLLMFGIQLNVGLAIFNMIPLPPLDGSRILDHFVPYSLRGAWERFQTIAPLLLLLVIAGGGFLLAGPRSALTTFMYDIIRQVSGTS